MATKEKSIAPDKVKMFTEYDDVMKRIVAESKREVAQLQATRQEMVMRNAALQDEINRKQGAFEQYKRLEEEKLQQLKFKFNNEQIAKEKRLEIGELDMSRRQEEMARREEIGRAIVAKELKLNNDRIELEKIRSTASGLLETAYKKQSEASSMISQATELERKAKDAITKANAINETMLKREHDLEDKEKEIESRMKNLEELQKIIDPKIEELKILENKIVEKEKELNIKEESVNAKLVEERTLVKDLDAEKKNISELRKQLDQKDEEVTRKALMAGIKDA
jgi:chromosome segregation ATPase